MHKTKALNNWARTDLIKRLRTPSRLTTFIASEPSDPAVLLECVSIFKELQGDLGIVDSSSSGNADLLKELRDLNQKMDQLAAGLEMLISEATASEATDEELEPSGKAKLPARKDLRR